MADILLACSSHYGYTRRICETMKAELEGRGHRAEVVDLAEAGRDLARRDVVVIGASVRLGRHKPAVHQFIARHREQLARQPGAFFSVNLVARKSGKDRAATNPYLRKFLARIPWQPELAGVFAGNVDYPRYGALERSIIRILMWLTKGPTDPTARVEFTDWNDVRRFAGQVSLLAGGAGQRS